MRGDRPSLLVGTSPSMLDLKTKDRTRRPLGRQGPDHRRERHRQRTRGEGDPRRQPAGAAPFVPVNCAGMPETLLESELFGHVKGSFTGAYRDKPGKLEMADNGTIFLDEIGEMTLAHAGAAAAVPRDRRDSEGRRRPRDGRVDVRVIAATNRNLRDMIAQGTFREDLFYRMNVIHLVVPPLRERREDIPLLIALLPRRSSPATNGLRRHAIVARRSASQASDRLLAGPATCASCENVIERLVVTGRSETIRLDDLPPEVRCSTAIGDRGPQARAPPHGCRRSVQEAVDERESFWSVGLSALHAARDHAQQRARPGAQGSRGSARQLQDRGAAVQHGTSATTSAS